MDTSQIYLEPSWGLEDSRAARFLDIELREKLLGLDYRLRKSLGKYIQEKDDLRDDEEESMMDVGGEIAVAYHAEGVAESVDKLRVAAARFTIDLDEIESARRKKRLNHCRSSIRSFTLDPPAVELPRGTTSIPPVKVSFRFEVTKVAPTHRLGRKAPVGVHGVHALGVALRMNISALDSSDGTCSECSIDGNDFDSDAASDDWSFPRSSLDEAWQVPSMVSFASSHAFVKRVDAENEDGDMKRWWNEKEHRRQYATSPLRDEVLRPCGPFDEHVRDGGSILDLRRCEAKKLDVSELWKTVGCIRRSAQALWALFGRPSCGTAIVTPLRRSYVPRRRRSALETLSTCSDVVHIIAAFALEPAQYSFVADIYFAIGLTNF
eukprot:TRINITY_DN16890_c0_g1_i1.p1 TRINITY_DN16890_c0_g1~~TRINITY_DN16890_c0_g1_i1.p1  ORF type:complete len:402 (+),score=72.62 TRINITY_DN16890_c0_g1_i1:71-1207(+)